jgi:signal transduction histidine kinase
MQKSILDEYRYYLFEPLNVFSAVAQAIGQSGHIGEEKSVRIDILGDCQAVIHAHPPAFLVLLKCLLRNAIEAAPPNSSVQVTISGTGLAIRDLGAGIPPDSIGKLGKWFWHGPLTDDRFRLGIGLAITRTIVENHHWNLQVANTNPGACFFLGWPASHGKYPDDTALSGFILI